MSEEIRNKVRSVLTRDLLKPKYLPLITEDDPPETGHCYVGCEAFYHLIGGKDSGFLPHVMRVDGDTHWFLKNRTGIIWDPTKEQFPDGVDYSKGKPCGFLTREPSKRARIVIERVEGLK